LKGDGHGLFQHTILEFIWRNLTSTDQGTNNCTKLWQWSTLLKP